MIWLGHAMKIANFQLYKAYYAGGTWKKLTTDDKYLNKWVRLFIYQTMCVSEITCQEEHVVRVGPGLRDPRSQDPGTMRSRTHSPSLSFKSGTKGLPSKFKSGTPGPLSKFKIETHIMVFLHCFAYYILYEKLINFFKEIIFYE